MTTKTATILLFIFTFLNLSLRAEKKSRKNSLPEITNIYGIKTDLKKGKEKDALVFRIENHTDTAIQFMVSYTPIDLKLGITDEKGNKLKSIYNKNQFSSFMGGIKSRKFHNFQLDMNTYFSAENLKKGKYLTGVFTYKSKDKVVQLPFKFDLTKLE